MESGDKILLWLQDSYFITPRENSWENITWTSFEEQNTSKYADFSEIIPYNKSKLLDVTGQFSNQALNLLAEYSNQQFTTSAAHLGLTTGLILAILLNLRVDIKESSFQQWLETMFLKLLFTITCLVLTLAAAPIISVFMVCLMLYRQGVHIFLKLTKSNYAGLMEGLDAIWAIEEETSKSIINILAIIEVENLEQGNNLLEIFRKIIVKRFATDPLPCPKIFHFRQKCLGYFYWERQSELKIEDYIRSIKTVNQECSQENGNNTFEMSEDALKNLVAEVSNSSLPADHAACWEVLVGSQPVVKSSAQTSESNITQLVEERFPEQSSDTVILQYPIIFRIHHALGDGIALMHLLVSTMADSLPCSLSENMTTPSPVPPSIPIPTRKFSKPSNSSDQISIPDHKISPISTKKRCCELNRDNTIINNRHKAQSPQELNTNQEQNLFDNIHPLNEHMTKISSSKEKLSNHQFKLGAKDISIDIYKTGQDDALFKNQVTKNVSSAIIESKSSPAIFQENQLATRNNKAVCLDSFTTDCRQRPLLLTNRCSSPLQNSKPPYLTSPQFELDNRKHVLNKQNHFPTSIHCNSSNIENIQQESNCNHSTSPCSLSQLQNNNHNTTTTTTSSNVSLLFNPNFHSSLPTLSKHCPSPKNKITIQRLPLNSTTKPTKTRRLSPNSLSSLKELPFNNHVTNIFHESQCSSPQPIRKFLEEPPSVFSKLECSVPSSQPTKPLFNSLSNNAVVNNQCMLPANEKTSPKSIKRDIPRFNSDHISTTRLPCYNHISTSDSYITVPGDISMKSTPVQTTEKGTNTSTTIYYFNTDSSTTQASRISAPYTNKVTNSTASDQLLKQNNCNTSANFNAEINSESSSPNYSFEELNFMTASQTSPHGISPNKDNRISSTCIEVNHSASEVNSSKKVPQCPMGQYITYNKDKQRYMKAKDRKWSNRKKYVSSPLLMTSPAATINSDHGNSFVKKFHSYDEIDCKANTNCCQELKYSNGCHKECISNFITETLDKAEDWNSSAISTLKVDNFKTFWNSVKGTDKNDENADLVMTSEPLVSSQSSSANQYVQLLNTISNSNLSKYDKLSNLGQTIYTLASAPASLIHQALIRGNDMNALHGPPLSGSKVIAWHRDQTGDLFKQIKRVKKHSNARFTEIFLTALSASLETYFKTHQTTWGKEVPAVVTVVIPARMELLNSKQNSLPKNTNVKLEVARKSDRLMERGYSVPLTIPEETTMDISNNENSTREDNFESYLPNETPERLKLSDINEEVPLTNYTVPNAFNDKERDCEGNNDMTVNSGFTINEDIIKLPVNEGDNVQDSTVSLNNRFSLALLALPITSTEGESIKDFNGSICKTFSPEKRLDEIQHSSELLRKSLDYQVNYWLLNIVATFLPASLLQTVIQSSQSTLVMSNIVGPSQILSLAGNRLRDLMFWIPNRGATGIGITLLSYMGHLQIGIIADQALISCKQDAQMILDETVLELRKLDAVVSLNRNTQ